MITISSSVGVGGTNRPIDAMAIQYLLNLNYASDGLTIELPVNGIIQREALDAIKVFQRDVVGLRLPDGKISPGGVTMTKLLAADSTSPTTLAALRAVMAASPTYGYIRPGELSSSLGVIDSTKFMTLYSAQLVRLGAGALSGLAVLLDFINGDSQITDVAWCAYMLATVKHECAERWQPIQEFGKGAGSAYGVPVTVTDAATGTPHTNTYYGRGYVQLTWERNYRAVGRAIGLGDDLVLDPSLALDPQVAYSIMTYGMTNGTFTGKKLSNYIDRNQCDYANARRIINGLDRNLLIAGYAEKIELLLRATCTESVSSCF